MCIGWDRTSQQRWRGGGGGGKREERRGAAWMLPASPEEWVGHSQAI